MRNVVFVFNVARCALAQNPASGRALGERAAVGDILAPTSPASKVNSDYYACKEKFKYSVINADCVTGAVETGSPHMIDGNSLA